jgi:hypothetical protein
MPVVTGVPHRPEIAELYAAKRALVAGLSLALIAGQAGRTGAARSWIGSGGVSSRRGRYVSGWWHADRDGLAVAGDHRLHGSFVRPMDHPDRHRPEPACIIYNRDASCLD